ncbi:MAG: CbrC family protein [Verrucomicrobia bacterium]|nr:CbrC family protein [Verrucomicrobiota bacterium]
MTTSAEPGTLFPLFEAPLDEAARFNPEGHCSICLYLPKPTLRLGAGAGVVVRCRACGTTHALDADVQEHTPCRACGHTVKFPRLEELWDFIGPTRKQTVVTCFDCLRRGRTAITKLTEYGVVTWESAIEGLIDWVPEGTQCPMRVVRLGGGQVARLGALVPGRALFDLVCTPMYRSWTTPVWLFCCGTPMAYIGAWSKHHFERLAPGDGEALFANALNDTRPGIAGALWHYGFGYDPRVYVFRCRQCGRLRANWDRNPSYSRPPRNV